VLAASLARALVLAERRRARGCGARESARAGWGWVRDGREGGGDLRDHSAVVALRSSTPLSHGPAELNSVERSLAGLRRRAVEVPAAELTPNLSPPGLHRRRRLGHRITPRCWEATCDGGMSPRSWAPSRRGLEGLG
jgi:hypothetical protein